MISLATLIKKVSALTGRVTKVAGKMDSLTRLFEGLDESFRNHVELWESSSRDRIVGAIKQHNAIEELGKTSESLVICNGDLNERMDKLQGEVGGLENIRGSLNSRVTNVEGELDELRGGGEGGGGGGSEMNLRDRIETLEDDAKRLKATQYVENQSRRGSIGEAESRLETIEKQLGQPSKPTPATLFTRNSEALSRVKGMENILNELREYDDGYSVDIPQIVSALDGHIGWLSQWLRRQRNTDDDKRQRGT